MTPLGTWRCCVDVDMVTLLHVARPAVKVAPSIATSFFTYELVKDFLLS